MPSQVFLPDLKGCKARRLRKNLQEFAIHKDGDKNNASHTNLIFPHQAVLSRVLKPDGVKDLIRCGCPVCGPVNIPDKNRDDDLVETIMAEPDRLISLAVLVWMG